MSSPADTTLLLPGKYPLRISLGAHRGVAKVDLRFHYAPADGGPLRPTLRGVTLPAGNLPEIIEALERLKAQMICDGALDAGSPPKFKPHVYPRDF